MSVLILTTTASSRYKRQQKDFEVFITALYNKEGILDINTSQNKIDSTVNSLRLELKNEKTALEQFKLYSKVIASLNSGHTQVHPDIAIITEWLAAKKSIPLDYYLIGRHLVVNEIDTADYSSIYEGYSEYQRAKHIAPKSEIIEIDNKTIPEMVVEMGKYVSSDENAVSFKYYQVTDLFEFYRHIALPFDKDSVLVKYITKGDTNSLYFSLGKAPIQTINARMYKESLKYEDESSEIGTFKIIKSKYGYFRFKSFTSCYGSRFDHFLNQSFKKLKRGNINKLVIDLRGNTGGAMQYSFMRYMVGEGVELGRYIVEKPKTFSSGKYFNKFDTDYRKHVRLSRRQKIMQKFNKFNNGIELTEYVDSNLIFKGEVVIITDGSTFSSASILACHLKTMNNAKMIGIMPGGSFYAGNAGTIPVKLPYSGVTLFVNPNTFYSHLDKVDDPLKIKEPDVVMDPLFFSTKKRDAFYFKSAIDLFN